MMPRRLLLLLALGLLASLPATVRAQGRVCDLYSDPSTVLSESPDGRQMIISGGNGPRFDCTGDVRISADSAVIIQATKEIFLYRSVKYADSVKTLTAEWLRYDGSVGMIHAETNVVLTDRTGSVVRGQFMDYFQAGEGRPQPLAVIYGQPRPHAMLRRAAPPGAVPDTAAPLEVVADRMEVEGETGFRAVGAVRLTRGDVAGSAQEGSYDQAAERMTLLRSARLSSERFEISGDRIDGFLEGEEVRLVHADSNAVLLSEELEVRAPAIRIGFQDGDVHDLVARGKGSVGEGTGNDEALRARANARNFRLVADSIDALAPGQQLEQVLAAGGAYAEQLADSADPAVPSLLSRDWLRGDSIRAFFAPPPPAPAAYADTVPPEERRVLERLVATGPDGNARAGYRMRDEQRQAQQPGFSYVTADRIDIRFRDGQVEAMEADGAVRGIYLEPKTTAGTGNRANADATAAARPPAS